MERIPEVLHVFRGHVRDVDRALRLAAHLPVPAVNRSHGRGRHQPANLVDRPVDDIAHLQLRDGIERPDPDDTLVRVQVQHARNRGEDVAAALVRPLPRLELFRHRDLVAGKHHSILHRRTSAAESKGGHTDPRIYSFAASTRNRTTGIRATSFRWNRKVRGMGNEYSMRSVIRPPRDSMRRAMNRSDFALWNV